MSKRAEYKKQWQRDNVEKHRLADKKWREKNPDKIRERHARHRKTQTWRDTHRRLQMKRRGGEATKATLKEVLDTNLLQHGLICCENCYIAIGERYEFDHIIPVALGGDGNYNNLQVLCKPCNLEKNTNAIDFRRIN